MVNQETGPEAQMQYFRAHNAGAEFVLEQLIEICAEHYHGYDLAEDAIDIAKLVICTGSKDEHIAQRILGSMGYIASDMACWKSLKPETVTRAKQIRFLALPGYGD